MVACPLLSSMSSISSLPPIMVCGVGGRIYEQNMRAVPCPIRRPVEQVLCDVGGIVVTDGACSCDGEGCSGDGVGTGSLVEGLQISPDGPDRMVVCSGDEVGIGGEGGVDVGSGDEFGESWYVEEDIGCEGIVWWQVHHHVGGATGLDSTCSLSFIIAIFTVLGLFCDWWMASSVV
nr:hypothetical protein [Tanacetum cinerariifolium]